MAEHPDDGWEKLAREDAESYIWARERGASDEEFLTAFFGSGEVEVPQILDRVAGRLPGNRLVIEYGCGVGRLLIPMSRQFESAIGVDVSPTMLGLLEENCRRLETGNITTALEDSGWEVGAAADLVYSWAVFRHIQSTAVLTTAIRRIAASLRPEGIAYLHFHTRRRTPLYWLRFAVPDRLMPKFRKRAIRSIRRPIKQVRQMLRHAGLVTIAEFNGDDTVFVVRPDHSAIGSVQPSS